MKDQNKEVTSVETQSAETNFEGYCKNMVCESHQHL